MRKLMLLVLRGGHRLSGEIESRSIDGSVGGAEVKSKACCPKCGNDRPRRLERKGWLQQRFYPLFGYYPWQCRGCRAVFLLRKRFRRRREKVES
jgi:ribosomal protein L37AE/L43A